MKPYMETNNICNYPPSGGGVEYILMFRQQRRQYYSNNIITPKNQYKTFNMN